MGTMPDELSELLFSRTRARLLGLFFGQPGRSYYLTELFRLTGIGRGAVQRELARLEKAGLVNERRRGNQRLYQANESSPVYAELKGLVEKTAGVAGTIGEALRPAGDAIRCAFIFGSIASGKAGPSSDVDLFIIGNLSFERVVRLLLGLHEHLGREINPVVMTPAQFRSEVSGKTPFIQRVLKSEKIFLKGDRHDLEEPAQDRSADRASTVGR